MKQSLISFIHQPKKVIALSLVVAVLIGIFGYMRIHKAPTYQFVQAAPGIINGSENGASGVKNLTLGFLVGGRIKSVSVKAGDTVKQGQVLATLDAQNAAGVLAQAKAAYATAQANYQKVVNGATGTAIDVAKAAVNTAQVSFDQATSQQKLLVANAHRNLLNSTLVAKGTTDVSQTPPIISGTYTGDTEGTITFTVHEAGNSGYITLSGLTSGTADVSTTVPEPIGTTGLFIEFPSVDQYVGTTWSIAIPNTTAPNYLANYNAYQSALQNQTQAVASAQATLDQAKAALTQTVTAARPEDVAAAQAQVDSAYGALQIAEAAYNNTIITAPGDGKVTSVSISVGQIATISSPAIEVLGTVASKNAAIVIPENALTTRDGKFYVQKKVGGTVEEIEVTVGATDAANAEIISGLAVGDEVALH